MPCYDTDETRRGYEAAKKRHLGSLLRDIVSIMDSDRKYLGSEQLDVIGKTYSHILDGIFPIDYDEKLDGLLNELRLIINKKRIIINMHEVRNLDVYIDAYVCLDTEEY